MNWIRSGEALGGSSGLGPMCMTLGGRGWGVELPPPSLVDQTTTFREVATGEFGGRHNVVSAVHPWSESAKLTPPLISIGVHPAVMKGSDRFCFVQLRPPSEVAYMPVTTDELGEPGGGGGPGMSPVTQP